MKKYKRFISIALVTMIMISAFAFPVSALSSEWRYEFRNQFPLLSQGSGSNRAGYISALQTFLLVHPTSSTLIEEAGGIDGAYGGGTYNAVRQFQSYAAQNLIPGMAVDGITGGDTWACIAILLSSEYNEHMTFNGINVYTADVYNNQTALFYFKNGIPYYFHTVVGDYPDM